LKPDTSASTASGLAPNQFFNGIGVSINGNLVRLDGATPDMLIHV